MIANRLYINKLSIHLLRSGICIRITFISCNYKHHYSFVSIYPLQVVLCHLLYIHTNMFSLCCCLNSFLLLRNLLQFVMLYIDMHRGKIVILRTKTNPTTTIQTESQNATMENGLARWCQLFLTKTTFKSHWSNFATFPE